MNSNISGPTSGFPLDWFRKQEPETPQDKGAQESSQRIQPENETLGKVINKSDLKLDKKTGTYFKSGFDTGLTPDGLKKIIRSMTTVVETISNKFGENPSNGVTLVGSKTKLEGGRKRGGRTVFVSLNPKNETLSFSVVQSRLGRGGFGKVYKTFDLETGTIRSFKRGRTKKDYHKKYDNEKKTMEKARKAEEESLREIDILNELNEGDNVPSSIPHPPDHVVRHMTPSGEVFTGYTGTACEGDGAALCEIFKENDKNKIEQLKELFNYFHAEDKKEIRQQVIREILEGMAYAHAKGIYHTDFKPDNCLVARFNKDGQIDRQIDREKWEFKIYIADWGGGICERDLDSLNFEKGTKEFMCSRDMEEFKKIKNREQLKILLKRRDVFATGASLLMILFADYEPPYQVRKGEHPDLRKDAVKEVFGVTYEKFQNECWPVPLKTTFDDEQTTQLIILFKKMLDSDYTKRPSMEEALNRYKRIVAPRTDNKNEPQ